MEVYNHGPTSVCADEKGRGQSSRDAVPLRETIFTQAFIPQPTVDDVIIIFISSY